MAEPGGAVAAETARRDEILETAVEEGHDADIPSYAGYIDDKKDGDHSSASVTGSNMERDPEKASVEGDPTETVKGPEVNSTPADPNIVDWDGPDDPENPMNWKTGKKGLMVGILSLLTLVTPLASSMFAPGPFSPSST